MKVYVCELGGMKCSFFWKIWCALSSLTTHLKIRPFALLPTTLTHPVIHVNIVNDTHGENCVLLNLVQEVIEIEFWLLLTFSLCLHKRLTLYILLPHIKE